MERETWEKLYEELRRPLFLYAFSLCRNREDAEDLTASAFVKAMLSFPGGNLQSWLYAVLRNEFFTQRQKRRRTLSLEALGTDTLMAEDDILDQCIQNEERRWLYRAIDRLPPQEREVMLLTIQLPGGDADIAQVLGLSVSHVRVLRHRGKQRILQQHQEESP